MSPVDGQNATGRLAGWIAIGSRSVVGDKSVRAAKPGFLDVVGCMLAGSVEPAVGVVRRTLAAAAAVGDGYTIVGWEPTSSPYDAALMNGLAGHAHDYDDYDNVSYCHPSVVLVPALLALAERRGASGREVLQSYVVGYTVMQLLGSVMNPHHYASGFHATGTIGAVGAAAACSHLSCLDAKQTAMALGIAGSLGAGLRASFGTSTKPLHAGRAASCGALATDLADGGFDAAGDLFDVEAGFPGIYTPGAVAALGQAIDQLSEGSWPIMRDRPSIKPFASCGGTHSAIAAVLELRDHINGYVEAIDSIHVRGPALTLSSVLIHHAPVTGLEAKFSLEGALAVALVDGTAGVAQFNDASLRRPEVTGLMAKIHPIPDKEMDATLVATHDVPIVVTLRLGDQVHEVARDHSPGSSYAPLDDAAVLTKFAANASMVLDAHAVEACAGLLQVCDTLGQISELTGYLRRAPPRP